MIATFFRFLLIIIDKLVNVLLLGSPHKTISMRLAFACHCRFVEPRYKWVRPLANMIDILFYNRFYVLEEDHIYKNYEAEEVLSLGLWQWYNITNPKGYLQLVATMSNSRFIGRD